MPSAHEAFKALGPINWDDIAQDQLDTFLKDVFSDAQSIVDSIPVSLSSQKVGYPRSATDTNLPSLPSRAAKSSDRITELRKEWKEVKVNPRENPLGLDVYKLSAKDGKGAWFARRSVHDGLTFEKWKLGMEKELDESMKVQGKPGDGSIRGIGADRKVVNQTVEGSGRMQVYQLSAQFPGPTTPRDFVTLLLSSDSAIDGPDVPKHFMLVSKPCIHPECPPRQGYIRGQYESVEFIREIRVEKPLRKTRSSIDLPKDESTASIRNAENLSREATIRSARQAAGSDYTTKDETGRKRGKTIGSPDLGDDREDDENYETMIEWLMVTRSDPGGSVPRFMIERGTPPGIAGDANKFVKWISSKSIDDFTEDDSEDTKLKREASQAEEEVLERKTSANPVPNMTKSPSYPSVPRPSITEQTEEAEDQPGPTGFYGMIANALNAAATVAASRIPITFGSAKGGDSESSDLSSEPQVDDASSIHSFHSLEDEGIDENDNVSPQLDDSSTQLTPSVTIGGAESTRSTDSLTARSAATSQHEKELKKLEERKRKTEEKLRRAQEKALAKRGNNTDDSASQRDEVAMQKLRERHEREMAKQQEKYQKELKKLEAKRASEQKKAEDRRRKTIEREEKANLAMELEKVRAERDIARKQMDILKEQIGDLQAQNTMLVARLGREGIVLDDAASGSSLGSGVNGLGIKRSMTEGLPTR
ncbi:hypothetical protein F5Y04DRAFT_251764 [Hypomontagnella monticulosa]|nr:hypothetical protein F5Y04DRAFT_251764 [Hypomontagnella monticulosa]